MQYHYESDTIKIFLIKEDIGIFARYCKLFVLPFKRLVLIIIAASVVSTLLALVNPYISKMIIDVGLKNKDLIFFMKYAVCIVCISVGELCLNKAIIYWSEVLSSKVFIKIERYVVQRIARCRFDFFTNTDGVAHIYKIENDIRRVSQYLTNASISLGIALLQGVLTFVVVCYMSWIIAMVSLFFALFLYIVPYIFSDVVRAVSLDWLRKNEYAFKRLTSMFKRMYIVKAFGREHYEYRTYINAQIRGVRAFLERTRLTVVMSLLSALVQKSILAVIVLFGGWQVMRGHMTLGVFTAILLYFGKLFFVHQQMAQMAKLLPLNIVACRRVNEIIHAMPPFQQQLPVYAGEKNAISGAISCCNVSFGYTAEHMVFSDVSFDIPQGAYMAFAGLSGCGKTTLVNLMLQVYQPAQGSILIDGKPITHIDEVVLRNSVRVCVQDTHVWNDTIAVNIQYGDLNASLQEIQWAAQCAEADTFIQTLSHGYESIIGDHGSRLSAGQKQRIAIARALVMRPRIVIFDEAFSCIDEHTEQKIITNIRRELPDTTLIIVSHRFSAIKRAERVFYFDRNGGIVAGGAQDWDRYMN